MVREKICLKISGVACRWSLYACISSIIRYVGDNTISRRIILCASRKSVVVEGCSAPAGIPTAHDSFENSVAHYCNIIIISIITRLGRGCVA